MPQCKAASPEPKPFYCGDLQTSGQWTQREYTSRCDDKTMKSITDLLHKMWHVRARWWLWPFHD